MKIKRYFAPTIREALNSVRDELGLDAVILSNTTVEGGIEIVAAVDYAAAATAPPRTAPSARPAPRPKPAATPAGDPALVDMHRELNSLRGLLENQLSGLAWGELARRHPRRARLIQDLRGLGLSIELCRSIADQVADDIAPERAWGQALALLAHRLHVVDADVLDRGGAVALIGPTGVGKTTTLAKLATRFVLRHGARQLALLSIDSERIGAHEQVRAYGRILGVPTATASSRDELAQALVGFGDKRLVLIDTPGLSHRHVNVRDHLGLLASAGANVQPYLVLSAATQLAALRQAVRLFQPIRPRACVVTKTDEAATMGDFLSVAVAHALPLAFVSAGQRVPEDLRPARAHQLISLAAAAAKAATQRPSKGVVQHGRR